jgi:hypothetical protein
MKRILLSLLLISMQYVHSMEKQAKSCAFINAITKISYVKGARQTFSLLGCRRKATSPTALIAEENAILHDIKTDSRTITTELHAESHSPILRGPSPLALQQTMK